MHFLIPSDPLSLRLPDETFADQLTALVQAGFSTSLLPEGALSEGRPLRGIPHNEKVVYRGWMFTAHEYATLVEAIDVAGGASFTTLEEYTNAHYLPQWYPLVSELTPETVIVPSDADLAKVAKDLGWGSYFIKDYVKSLKTSTGSIARNFEEMQQIVDEMQKYRGHIEGGICLRQVEDLVPGTELRYFVISSQAYCAEPTATVPNVVHACAERIHSPFFSVDVAKRADGALRVVEVGDGQVSDLVGWSPERFAEIWKQHS